jgi:aldose 1-epimerase
MDDSTRRHGAPEITSEVFGHVLGEEVHRYTLSAGGVRAGILTYGGILQSFHVPGGRDGTVNVVLGFSTFEEYLAANGGLYFGALIGRFANRIAGGVLRIDGVEHRLPVNSNGNMLHGGAEGFHTKIWAPRTARDDTSASLCLRYVSPHGEMGFPGTLTTEATYTLDVQGRLTLDLHAVTDRPTVVNLTNHTFWNLAGEGSGSVYDHLLQLFADRFTPVDAAQIPTGLTATTSGTPFDFSAPTAIGERIRTADPQLRIGQGYDLNFVVAGSGSGSGSDSGLPVPAARVVEPRSGRTLTISTTQPGIQFYSGNYLTGAVVGTSGSAYRQSAGFALEPQHFPDSPNHDRFPSTVVRPGEDYRHTIVYQVSEESRGTGAKP